MTSDRWRRIEALYHEMLARPEQERAAALAAACADDAALQAEVQSLLDQPASAEAFLATPALEVAAQLVAPASARLTGRRIGVFEVQGLLGVGGMGEVYRARDTRLKRAVAIKILPRAFQDDPSRLARFEREARVLASLNHPHIGAIHGLEEADGVTALIMELVDGDDLSQRLARGRIPIAEALTIARQIAEALEAAHEQGVIHRDLKPANIKLRRDGTVKVLDFGLAKALAPASDDGGAVTAMATEAGLVMGTPAYMSPEQARGEAVDRQTDIWAFGVLLYELLTGVSPFARPTVAETLARILGASPDHALLPQETPGNVGHLLRRCLERDRKRRWQHMGDARIELEEALAVPASAAAPAAAGNVPTNRWLRQTAAVTAVAVLAGIIGWAVAARSDSDTPGGVVHLSIADLPQPFASPFGISHLAISEDGSLMAFASWNRITIRRFAQAEGVAIDVAAANPFFSVDGEWVGFFDQAPGGGLKKVPARGGMPTSIIDTPERPGGATWGPDGTIVFATATGLFRISENGGEARLLVKPDPERRERMYAWPRFLPDGRSVLFTIVPQDSIEAAEVALLDLSTLDVKKVVSGGSAARYASTGHLVYASGQTLKAIAFDPVTQQARGDPVPLRDITVATSPDNGAADFALSNTGTLIFAAPGTSNVSNTLSWVDRRGNEEPLALPTNRYAYPRVSPDGTRVALDISGASRDIWILNLTRGNLTRLTRGPTEDMIPVWSRDGSRVFFASDRAGDFDVYSQAADGASTDRVEFAGPGFHAATSAFPDGTRLLVSENSSDLSILDLNRPARLEPLLHSTFRERNAVISPDGKWIAYESNESGGRFEIFLRPFPDVDGQREQVSIDGGLFPLWGSKDSGELFYLHPNGGMMSATVRLSPALTVGSVTKLFDWGKLADGSWPYDISRVDGRFLMTKPSAGGAGTISLSVVLNWFEELREQVRKP